MIGALEVYEGICRICRMNAMTMSKEVSTIGFANAEGLVYVALVIFSLTLMTFPFPTSSD